ncbi:hypothetical protein Cgig2_023831 [Carnegiea gigantea]|uniref:IBH1-like N-terminal domain-containing protein n=1 Tax=Carnegiea gigantea TaxID=171969 RepID=A0A9Q1K9H8_9CARY|nr:hypothetical protein Cgig2_023831 [Carnegiea gigantea]
MQSESSLKREFMKKWLMGLQKCSSSEEKMSLLERKKAIKLSADLAMASTRNSNSYTTKFSWSHGLISEASKDTETGFLAKRILGPGQPELLSQAHLGSSINDETRRSARIGSRTKVGIVHKKKKKKIVSTEIQSVKNGYKVRARAIAKRLVKKRTQILKGLVPGGEAMDENSLIKEALDYIVSLRAQVDVMHHVANSPQLLNHNKCFDFGVRNYMEI